MSDLPTNCPAWEIVEPPVRELDVDQWNPSVAETESVLAFRPMHAVRSSPRWPAPRVQIVSSVSADEEVIDVMSSHERTLTPSTTGRRPSAAQAATSSARQASLAETRAPDANCRTAGPFRSRRMVGGPFTILAVVPFDFQWNCGVC